MLGIIFTVALTLLAAYAVWTYMLKGALVPGKKGDNNAMYLIGVLAAALVLRVILAAVYKGHDTDMNCFIGWSNAVFEHGVSNFYTLDMFHDYPPGYMYVLYVIGAIEKLFGFSGGVQYVLIKLPAIICDLISGYVIYKVAKKKFSDGVSAIIAAIYVFNPAVILNSSIWGQVDSVYTMFALLMIYFITEKKMIYSYFMFALCLFIKPQAFIFTPVLIGGIIENVFRDNFTKEKLLKNLGLGLCAIALIFVLALPFGFGNVVEQYKITLESYPHLSVNAFNIYSAVGQNWGELTPFASFISYVLLAAISVYAVYIIVKSRHESKYYFAGALLAFLTYMLSVKMHERYAFPAMALLLLALISSVQFKGYILYALVTASQIFNSAWALFLYSSDPGKYYRTLPVTLGSWVNIALMIFLLYYSYKMYIKGEVETLPALTDEKTVHKPSENTSKADASKSNSKSKTNSKAAAAGNALKKKITPSTVFPKIVRADLIAMAILTAVYTCVALYDLGDMHAPQTDYNLPDGEVTIDLGQDYQISGLKYYLGSYELEEDRNISIVLSASSGEQTYTDNITSGSVFRWEEMTINAKVRYIRLSTVGKELTIKEFAVLDRDGNAITPVNVTPEAAKTLFDEQSEIPERQSFRNSTYFDEIYHARTAYEFVHHLSVYEWTHPPLGKAFIALGVLLFGMCPFGWRIVGTVFGIIMVPVIYMFAKKLLKKSWLAAVTCVLFTFDFMHFAQTRIATIDVYVTFFIMLMYYFMYKYYSTSFYDTPFKKGLGMLALSGTAMGLGIASKWTGIYAGMGLAVLFFITLYRRYDEYRYAVKNPKGETDGISHQFIIDNFKPYTIKTLIWCVVFFAVVPVIIYLLAYIPYLGAPDQSGLASIFANQESMLTYHSKTVLGSTHPFSSHWYEWIIMKRPIWYFSGTLANGLKEGISSFGNPLVWWAGIPAFFYMIYLAVTKKDRNSLFLVIGYLAQLVSWIPITRLTFIYHYFPCVPFIVLMVGYSLYTLYNEAKNKKRAKYIIIGYSALVVVMFVMFYPVLSGMPVNPDYVKHFLKWFDSWILI